MKAEGDEAVLAKLLALSLGLSRMVNEWYRDCVWAVEAEQRLAQPM